MDIKKIIQIANKPVGISACVTVVIITGLATHSSTACILEIILLPVIAYCWYEYGVVSWQKAKNVRKGRRYIYLGNGDPKNTSLGGNLDCLLLGALKFKFKVDNYHGDSEVIETKSKIGVFTIGIVTDKLIVGEEYFGDLFMHNEMPHTTLRLARKD